MCFVSAFWLGIWPRSFVLYHPLILFYNSEKYVSRAEYDELRARVETLETLIKRLGGEAALIPEDLAVGPERHYTGSGSVKMLFAERPEEPYLDDLKEEKLDLRSRDNKNSPQSIDTTIERGLSGEMPVDALGSSYGGGNDVGRGRHPGNIRHRRNSSGTSVASGTGTSTGRSSVSTVGNGSETSNSRSYKRGM
jgi:hypothetical protein